MSKISTKFSFVGKVGMLFGILVLGAYAKPSAPIADAKIQAPVPVQAVFNEIDANSLVRTVSFQGKSEPILRISKK